MGAMLGTRTLTGDPLTLLKAGIPMTLLMDLVLLDLPGCVEIASVERADAAWVHPAA